MKFLSKIRIGSKLYAGFGAVLAILALIAVLAITNVYGAVDGFKKYRSLARETNQAGRVQANVLLTRLFAKDYLISANTGSEASLRTRAAAAKDLAGELMRLANQSETEALAGEVMQSLQTYEDAFEVVVRYQRSQSEKVDTILNVVGPKIVDTLAAFTERTRRQNRTQATFNASVATRSILEARLNVFKFLTDNQMVHIERAKVCFDKFTEQLATLDTLARGSTEKSDIAALQAMRSEYVTALDQVVEAIEKRNALVQNTLDKVGPDVANKIEQMKLAVKEQQDTLGPSLTSDLSAAAQVMLITSLVAGFVGFGAAMTIARSIAKPLQAITASMNRLSGGETDVRIPCKSFKDEVGDMAQALSVFKNGIIERARLAEEAAQREAEKRAQDAAIEEERRQREEQERAREIEENRVREERAMVMNDYIMDFEGEVQGILAEISVAVHELEDSSASMASASEQSASNADVSKDMSAHTNANVQAVASASEEMSASIQEVSNNISQAADLSRKVAEKASGTTEEVDQLQIKAQAVSDVSRLISDIAEQTNLLALNATIEAARAGEAGKGFAVVAGEVKALADQTAKATSDIDARILEIQNQSESARSAMRVIADMIEDTNHRTSAVAAAVEEQTAATSEISRNAYNAASNTGNLQENIDGLSQATQVTQKNSQDVRNAAAMLQQKSVEMETFVTNFLEKIAQI